jgi:hypothetical protein
MADPPRCTRIRAYIGGIGHFCPSTGGTGQCRAFMGGLGRTRPFPLIYGHVRAVPSHIWTLDLISQIREALQGWVVPVIPAALRSHFKPMVPAGANLKCLKVNHAAVIALSAKTRHQESRLHNTTPGEPPFVVLAATSLPPDLLALFSYAAVKLLNPSANPKNDPYVYTVRYWWHSEDFKWYDVQGRSPAW